MQATSYPGSNSAAHELSTGAILLEPPTAHELRDLAAADIATAQHELIESIVDSAPSFGGRPARRVSDEMSQGVIDAIRRGAQPRVDRDYAAELPLRELWLHPTDNVDDSKAGISGERLLQAKATQRRLRTALFETAFRVARPVSIVRPDTLEAYAASLLAAATDQLTIADMDNHPSMGLRAARKTLRQLVEAVVEVLDQRVVVRAAQRSAAAGGTQAIPAGQMPKPPADDAPAIKEEWLARVDHDGEPNVVDARKRHAAGTLDDLKVKLFVAARSLRDRLERQRTLEVSKGGTGNTSTLPWPLPSAETLHNCAAHAVVAAQNALAASASAGDPAMAAYNAVNTVGEQVDAVVVAFANTARLVDETSGGVLDARSHVLESLTVPDEWLSLVASDGTVDEVSLRRTVANSVLQKLQVALVGAAYAPSKPSGSPTAGSGLVTAASAAASDSQGERHTSGYSYSPGVSVLGKGTPTASLGGWRGGPGAVSSGHHSPTGGGPMAASGAVAAPVSPMIAHPGVKSPALR